mmetsp:Transcript_16852/g.37416  ORF Transcript_16852/g.37416 Transcript_16852/m.37416 type:complete len:236 (-) Transcript_16852:855-1562(-)
MPGFEGLVFHLSSACTDTTSPCSSVRRSLFSLSTSRLFEYNFVGIMPCSGSGFFPTRQPSSSCRNSSDITPSRTSFKYLTKCRSFWRSTCFRDMVPFRTLNAAASQTSLSKQNSSSLPMLTGGNCIKSPTTTTCIPPKGQSFSWILRAIPSNNSNRSLSSMDISSIISTLHLDHLSTAAADFMTLFIRTAGSPLPNPIPANLCSVWPPMLIAAMPVGAVTATASSPCLCTISWIT